jgi:hypothetical protein
VFGRRRWRTPWSSGTSGEPSAVGTPAVKVIPPGETASAGTGTASGRTSSPGAKPSWGPAGQPTARGAPESADPSRTRVIRIPASAGPEHPGDSASASSGAEPTRQRSRLALTARGAPLADEPPWEQAGPDRPGQIAPAVLAVVVVCALLGVLAAVAATIGGRTSSSPSPAASIAPAGVTAPALRAGPGASGAGAKHGGGGHGNGERGRAAPPRTSAGAARGVTGKPTVAPAPAGAARAVTGKPTATPKSTGRAGRGAGRAAHHRQARSGRAARQA